MASKLQIILILIYSGLNLTAHPLLDVTQYGYEQYQNIVINGQVVPNMPPTNGQQPEERYIVIKKILDLYERQFTMLDIGAAQGYHSLMAAWQYPESVFVMIEGNNPSYPMAGDQLLSICKCNYQLKNIIHLNKPVIVSDLQKLGACEHFDVVLALNIIHWLGDDYKQTIETLLTLGDNIIIETPPAGEGKLKKEIVKYLEEINAELLGYVPRHAIKNTFAPMYLIKSDQSKKLTQSTWIGKNYEYEIISEFKEKKLKKIDDTSGEISLTDWAPGINLITFKMYNGAYPEAETLKNEITRLKDAEHTDWNPNNFIIQGHELKLIDFNSSFCSNSITTPQTYDRLNMMLKFVEAKSDTEAEYLFWQTVGSTRKIAF